MSALNPPLDIAVLAARLNALSDAVVAGPDVVRREFTMRIPAEPDRDADLVLSRAASALIDMHAEIGSLRDDLRVALEHLDRMHSHQPLRGSR